MWLFFSNDLLFSTGLDIRYNTYGLSLKNEAAEIARKLSAGTYQDFGYLYGERGIN
jgi:hypothetical protein